MPADAAAVAAIVLVSIACILLRPWRLPEYAFAVAGALCLTVSGLLPWADALRAIAKGADVYLFLAGMMLLAEVARTEGLFDWTARHAVSLAQGSARKLFALVYAVGVVVTVFLSNDATAVVLTPAVYAAARAARLEPLPYLYICAFVANAASFVLPISNPANLVVFAGDMPALLHWLRLFAAPSAVAIVVTYLILRLTQRRALAAPIEAQPDEAELSPTGRIAGIGLIGAALALLLASAYGADLGLPTFVCGLAVTLLVGAIALRSPFGAVRSVSWGVLPLVAGLFIMVEALARVGAVEAAAALLRAHAATAPEATALVSGIAAGFGANLANNLPLGLVAASAAQAAAAPPLVKAALLIGVDLGPNLSVTGSLATILWLIALRREGEHVGPARFLALGALVMPPALILSLAALLAI